MPLNPGIRLGPYEVIAPLGAGGMGEVYRAKDTRLGREVAIKVLPSSVADDPDRRARFEREAQAVAALSHPNIVAIHDTGIHDRQLYVVMELLNGQTLRERLMAGALPIRKAIEIAVQIARGLGAAHGKGLVHRDLKPENVFVQEDGQVKILDFGLARQTGIGQTGAAETMAATDPGIVLGTIGYMAPEQVRGQAVDARADVFAFGAVLFEMISGVRAFHRETAADTMTAILTQDPPELSGSRPDLSPALDRIVRHCLEKNPNERFQSARDVAFALESLSGTASSGATGATAAVQAATMGATAPKRRGLSPVLLAALVVVAAAAGVFGAKLLAKPPASSLKFTIKTFEPQSIFNARFMPDGETIVFSSAPTGNATRLFEIRPGTLEAQPIGPPNTHLLSVSSKGELAVLTDARYLNHRLFAGTLSRMGLEGAPKAWYEHVRDADWSPSGDDIAIVRDDGSRDQIEYPAGTVLYQSGAGYLSDPRVSPDGTRVAFMEHPSRYDDRGFVKLVDRSKHVVTLAGEFWGEQGVAWSPDGAYVMFAASGTASGGHGAGDLAYQINRATPDGRTAEFALTSPGDFTILDISKTGRWLATREETRYGIIVKGAGQSQERDLSWLDKCWGVNLSRDGQRILFADGNAGPDYAVAWRKVDGSPVVHLGAGDFLGESPDGKWVLGIIPSTAQLMVYPMGAGDPRKLDTGPIMQGVTAVWAPDSRHVIVLGSEGGKPPRLYQVSMSGGAPIPVFDTAVSAPIFLPDGIHALAWLANGQPRMFSLKGDAPTPVKGLQSTDDVVAVTSDSRAVLVQQNTSAPAKVDRIDLTTGARTPFKEFGPPDQSGLVRIHLGTPVMKPDASQYAYGYVRRLSTLFSVTPATK